MAEAGLVAANLAFGYRPGRPVLAGVGVHLEPGELVGVIGPNGAGKSTLLRLLTGLERPHEGVVRLDGRPLARWGRRALARRLAVVPQSAPLPSGFRAHDIVMMGRAPHFGFVAGEGAADRGVVERVMRHTDTWALRDARVETLSGGERQRVVLARALAQEPRFLLLDEPTNHLDLRYQTQILALTEREVARGLGALAVLHDLNLAARCARLLVLAADDAAGSGRVVASGSPAEVLTEPLLRRVYRTDVRVLQHEGRPVVVPAP